MSKWLIRKTSGSLSKHKSKGDYADHRHGRKEVDFEQLPQHESMRHKGAHHTYLDTSLVKRWLHSKVGEPFDQVYSEFLTRVQPKYLDEYKDSIYWYVAPQAHVEVKPNGEVWGKSYGRPVQLPHGGHLIFYVDPDTGVLMRKDKA